MTNINKIINKYACTPYRYTIKKDVTIIDTRDGHFVFKKRKRNSNVEEIYRYLKSRSFDYYPKLLNSDDEYDIYEYVEDVNTPIEQKAQDIMNLLGLLHSKTTYFREMDISEYKSIYEDISSKLEDLNKYYTNLINSIENDIYMSPSGYFIARNISNVFGATQYCQKELEKWYKYIKDNPKKREVMIHNNPDLNHLVRNDNLYLLSWDKAKSDMPIYDLYNFYKNSHTNLDYNELLKIYENKYPLHDEEKRLLFILLAIPDKIILEDNEYENCKKAKKIFDYLYKVYHLTAPYHTPPEKEEAADLND